MFQHVVYSKTVAFLKGTIHTDFALWVSLEIVNISVYRTIPPVTILHHSNCSEQLLGFTILSGNSEPESFRCLKLLTACAMSAAFDISVPEYSVAFQIVQASTPFKCVHASVQKKYADVCELSSVDRNLFVCLHMPDICMQNRSPLKAQIVVHQPLSAGLLPSCRCGVAYFLVKGQ